MAAEKEVLEAMQVNLPVQQARRVRAKAELRGSSHAAELKRLIFIAHQVEDLVGVPGDGIFYVTAPASSEAA